MGNVRPDSPSVATARATPASPPPPNLRNPCGAKRVATRHDAMGCGASKPPESPESAPEKQSIYKALDVKPPASAAPPKPAAAAAELHRPTALHKQATGGDV